MVGGAGRGDWLAGDYLPCVLLAAVPSLAMSEGKVAELDHVLSGEGKGERGGAAVGGVEGVGVGQQSGEWEGWGWGSSEGRGRGGGGGAVRGGGRGGGEAAVRGG